MEASEAILTLLKAYNVSHVFGLPGETTFPLYDQWAKNDEVAHVLVRDERNSAMMADGYARVSWKPGVCEAPGVGASYLLPGLTEAYTSAIPIIVLTSDIAEGYEFKNQLTRYEKALMFRGITKESFTIHRPEDVPVSLRRAFRVATSGRPGPVHVRIPENVLQGRVDDDEDVYSQPEYSKFPSHRYAPEDSGTKAALDLLLDAQRPVIVCGQGVLLSQAWDEVRSLADALAIPVGTTITGKGAFPETHPLSIGVVGSRGGTRFSNTVVSNSDLVFYVGSNVDFATTDDWTLPAPFSCKIIHLDISAEELGNAYRTDVSLLGDAKLTLERMISILQSDTKGKRRSSERVSQLSKDRQEYYDGVESTARTANKLPNPFLFVKALSSNVLKGTIFAVDPGIGAIYTSAFYNVAEAGRTFIYNYSVGGLGFALPQGIGAYFASKHPVLVLTGDGSMGFNTGELETLKRTGANVKIILFNNHSFGWIRAAAKAAGLRPFHTQFGEVDYMKVAEGYGLKAYRLSENDDLGRTLEEFLAPEDPSLLEVPSLAEDELYPPVPSWKNLAKTSGVPYLG
jgi:acetolactate synthase-1/2/3 large subunit